MLGSDRGCSVHALATAGLAAFLKGSESKLEAKETCLQAVPPGPPACRGWFIRPPPRSASTDPASSGQQPPSLKRGVGTCVTATQQQGLRLWLTCLCNGGAASRTMERWAAGSTCGPVAPATPVARHLLQPTGPGSSGLCGSPGGTPLQGGHSPDMCGAQPVPLGLEAAFTCRAAGWPTGSSPGRGPQGGAQGPPRHRELQEAACCPHPLPCPPVLATGPRSGPSGNIWARPGHLWMDRAVVC